MPQSPRMANDAVLPACKPCRSAWQKISICACRPINSLGLTGKFGSGSTLGLKSHKSHNCQLTFVISLYGKAQKSQLSIDICDFVIWEGCTVGGVSTRRLPCRGGRSYLV